MPMSMQWVAVRRGPYFQIPYKYSISDQAELAREKKLQKVKIDKNKGVQKNEKKCSHQ